MIEASIVQKLQLLPIITTREEAADSLIGNDHASCSLKWPAERERVKFKTSIRPV